MKVTPEMIDAAERVLYLWGGLRDNHLDTHAIARRMVEAAILASHRRSAQIPPEAEPTP